MKRIIVTILVIALALGFLFWVFKGDRKITNFPPQGRSIVAFGDSLVEGVGATGGNDFVSLLSRQVGEPIINMGVAGHTTRDGLARVSEANKQDPKVVLILLGGNDFLRKIPVAETFQNLDQIISKLQAEGAVIILLGVQGGLFSDGYDEYFEDLAEERGTLYVENVLDGLLYHDDLMSDSIHPNNLGYQKIADKVLPALKKALGK